MHILPQELLSKYVDEKEEDRVPPLKLGFQVIVSENLTLPQSAQRKQRIAATLSIIILAIVLCFRILSIITGVDIYSGRNESLQFKRQTPPIDLSSHIQHKWAQYSPYHASGKYQDPPKDCRITQVHILQRHGARYPVGNDNEVIRSAISKLKHASPYKSKRLDFLKNYTFELGSEALIPFGAAQSYDSGQTDDARYSHLINASLIPFVRASGLARVIDSASNWTSGFKYASKNKFKLVIDVIIPERETFNNTLNDNTCPAADDGTAEMEIWETIYASPIAKQINSLTMGASLTAKDISNLIMLCALETQAHARPGRRAKPSRFCNLFDQESIKGFEYYNDVEKYYKTGSGNALGPTQGVGYINELLTRLTGQPVRDRTQTNHTLDSDSHTFPLNRILYVDFTHENLMVAVYSAMGLFHIDEGLDPRKMEAHRGWRAARMVPFSTRLVVERLACALGLKGDENAYIRVFVNDALQPLEFCREGETDWVNDGTCTLDAFVQSQTYARSDGDGDYVKCFE